MGKYSKYQKVALWVLLARLGIPGQAAEYEVDGIIEQTIYNSDSKQFSIKCDFKVFVKDCKWLIQTIESDQDGGHCLKREIGSDNGLEIFEVVTTLDAGSRKAKILTGAVIGADAKATRERKRGFSTGTIVSNAVPVGQLDSSVVGHLWLMLASHCYLSGVTNHMLTPVYDVTASAPGNPELKKRTEWELMGGPGTLPTQVLYFEDNDSTSAVYRVTGITNAYGHLYPTGFVFERHLQRGRPPIGKQALAVVSAIRPVCSLGRMLPDVTGSTVVVDRRLARAKEPVKGFTYRVSGSGSWQPVADVKKAYDRRKEPKKPSPVMLPLIGTLLCAPLLVWAVHSVWRRKKKG